MIRINLLKHHAVRRRARPIVGVKTLVALLVVLGLGAAGLGIVRVMPLLSSAHRKSTAPVEEAPVAQVTPPAMSNSRIVEEVVRDISLERDKLQRSGILSLPYDQFSPAERINYEGLFALNVCDLLVRVMPGQIGLRSVEVEDFRTVYAVGLSSSRDEVTALFEALKTENVTMQPPPISFIRPNEKGGFRFGFACEPRWGLLLTDPYVDLSLSRLPSRGALESTMGRFRTFAREEKVALSSPLTRNVAVKADACRRFEYHFAASSTFAQFAHFVRKLHDENMPCAFKSFKLLAEPGGVITIDATVIFTTQE